MDILTLVFSSAIVSGVVTLLLGYILDSKKYIRDKRFSVYVAFLEQLDRTVPPDLLAKKMLAGDFMETLELESFKLDKNIQEIKLITKSERLKNHLGQISKLIDNRLYAVKELIIGEGDDLKREKILKDIKLNEKKINVITECTIVIMNEEICMKFF
jgi:hypothetical protein